MRPVPLRYWTADRRALAVEGATLRQKAGLYAFWPTRRPRTTTAAPGRAVGQRGVTGSAGPELGCLAAHGEARGRVLWGQNS